MGGGEAAPGYLGASPQALFLRRFAAIKDYNTRMRYRLRTLLIVLALGPPALAGAWWAMAYDRGRLAELLWGWAPGFAAIGAVAYVMARAAAIVTKR
jgi:hypothetical protein